MSNDSARVDPFSDVLPFVLTADARSFRAAARLLGVTPSAVSRAIARLETALGVRLLTRTSRSVTVTGEGAIFLERCREAVALMGTARSLVAAAHAAPAGLLRVTLPLGLGRSMLLPALPAFLAAYPSVRLHLILTDRLVDLVTENVDVAVRIGDLKDSGLVARQVGTSRFTTVAAPSYLRAFGRPRRPEDLAKHRCLKFALPSGGTRAWQFMRARRARAETVEVAAVVTADHGESLVDLACAGVGLVHVPDYLARAALADGRLEEVLRARSAPAGAVSCVRPVRHASAKVRAFIDFVAGVVAPADRPLSAASPARPAPREARLTSGGGMRKSSSRR